jgi:alpha,alpha-trehalase
MSNWTLAYDHFDSRSESLREALCTLGNGYFASRGAAPESAADEIHYPGTYLAGGYNRLKTEIAGHVVENEDLVNMPNWLLVRFRPEGGDWFNLMSVEILSYHQVLNVKEGMLTRTVRYRDRQQRVSTVVFQRLVHLGNPHLAAQTLTITAENWSGRIEVHSALDGTVINAGVERYSQLNSKHLEPLETGTLPENRIFLVVQTTQSRIRFAEAAGVRVYQEGQEVYPDIKVLQEPGYIGQEFCADIAEKAALRIEKTVSFYSSRDFAIADPVTEAADALRHTGNFEELFQNHRMEWDHLWDRCDIRVADQERTQMILRLHIFHLLQTVSRNSIDRDTGVPARGWHGEAYRGHIFWDELFIFPYLNLRIPMLTRSLLLYRYRRLGKARTAARRQGFRGALYPWQSGSNGREETQQLHLNPKSGRWLPDNSHLQRHVNTAIAYNIVQYFEATGDMEFMATYGVEMMLEIARLLASITSYNSGLDRYEITEVMGPDEYHDQYPGSEKPGLRNNSYTNIMTVWVLRSAIRVFSMLQPGRRQDLQETIGLETSEIEHWRDIIRKMRVVFHDGIISQFEGYDELLEFDWEGYRGKYGDIHRLDRILENEGDSTNRYKVSKQADVLMLFYLFSSEELQELFSEMGYDFDPGTIPKNIEYYLERSSNGSTLSNVVHSWVLARSDRSRSWDLFCRALESDISDIQGGTTHEGIHLGALAGTVDIIQRCYTGMEFRDDIVYFNPRIPEGLNRLTMRIKYRGNWLDVYATHESLTISSPKSRAIPARISFNKKIYQLEPGMTLALPL